MKREEYSEQLDEGGLVVRAICELLGKPKEHIDNTMKLLVKKAKEFPNSKVLKEKVFEAKKQENELFSSFVELEILFNNLSTLMDFCFNFMPSSIEVIEPEKIKIETRTLTSWINELQGRLHQVDKIAKESNIFRKIINKQFNTIIRTNILTHLKQGDISEKELPNYIGINKESLKPFLDLLIKKKQIKLENGKYKLAKKVKFK